MTKKYNLEKFGNPKMKRSFSNNDAKIQTLTTYAGMMKFSGLVNMKER